MPGHVGQLSRIDAIELLDGYLVSFTYTWGVWSGELQQPFQQLVRVDGDGKVEEVARRAIAIDLPSAYTNRNTWLSPVIRALCLGARNLFASPDPLTAKPDRVPAQVLWLAAACGLLSLLASIWVSGRQAHSPRGRLAWVVLCSVVGLPALASLWLLYPRRETVALSVPHAPPVAA